MKYILYCDESSKEGRYFSNFYGGALVKEGQLPAIESALNAAKRDLNLNGEIKWSKVTENYLSKYCVMMDTFFEFIRTGDVKIRIMFTQNALVPVGLTREQIENEFFLLYYQFFKHAYGFQYAGEPITVRAMFDTLPDTKDKNERFKQYIANINNLPAFVSSDVKIPQNQMAEVSSHDHVVLQCMDVILGSMYFRLNDLHREKPEGSWKRGKRTVAKEKLFSLISQHIRSIYPGFNIGVSTASPNGPRDRWLHAYRHWRFSSANSELDKSKGKRYPKND